MTKKSNNTFNLSVADRTKSNIILSLRVKSISGVGFLFFCILMKASIVLNHKLLALNNIE